MATATSATTSRRGPSSCIMICVVTIYMSMMTLPVQCEFNFVGGYGQEQVTSTIVSGNKQLWNIILTPTSQWATISIVPTNATSTGASLFARMLRRTTGSGGGTSMGASPITFNRITGQLYLVMKPSRTGVYCSTSWTWCNYTIEVSSTTTQSYSMSINAGDIIPYSTAVISGMSKGSWRFYAIEVDDSDLNVYMRVVPSQSNQYNDVDLYVFPESYPYNYTYGSGNPWNYVEEVWITSSTPYSAGLYIIGLNAWFNEEAPEKYPSVYYYTVTITANYAEQVYFGLSMFGIVGALTIFVLCLFFAAAIIARRRRAAELMAMEREGVAMARPVPPAQVGAPKHVIDKLPKRVYVAGSLQGEDARCSICLCDYDADDMLRDLKCGHSFHQPCIDQWLSQKRHCPLCQQDVERAHDAHNHHIEVTIHGDNGANNGNKGTPNSGNDEPSLGSRTLASGVPGQVHDGAASPTHNNSNNSNNHNSNNGASASPSPMVESEPAMVASFSPQITPTAAADPPNAVMV